MRNLLGRLHARDATELARIAAFWQVPLAGDRGAQVGALYRALTDLRSVRAAWDRLAPDERAMVRFLAVVSDAAATPTLAELAARLAVPEGEARETAVRLYRVGILARERDVEPLPVGEIPRLFLPRELALLFRRVQDDQDDVEAGDFSRASLPSLLARLDDAEIESAAAIWGLKVLPGGHERDDLVRRLLRQIGAPGGVDRVTAGLRHDVRRLWQRVRDEPAAAPIRLAEAAADVGLRDDEPRAAQRLRSALDELESTLLVWHTYRADGSRWLFVPAEIRAPPPVAAPLPPLMPVVAPSGEAMPWRHPDALAWDLLTLLRDLTDSPWPADGEPSRARLRHLNRRFWHRGNDVPPHGYVEFLIALALAEGLLRHDDGWRVPPELVRTWRERSFPAQTERLRWWWLASVDWIEGRTRGEVQVWGTDWPTARRKLLAALVDPSIGLDPGTWHTLDSVTARTAAHVPSLLGPTFTAATARLAGETGAGSDEETARLAAIAEVVGVELVTAFAWFGLVEPADAPGQPRAVRLTEVGVAVAAGSSSPAAAAAGDAVPPLVVMAAGEVELREPTPLRVWALSAFAEPERLAEVSVYRLSADALRRALAAGFDVAQVTSFLTKQSGMPLPAEVDRSLAAWSRGYRRVRLARAVVLTPDDPTAVAELGRLATTAGLIVRPLGDGSLLVGLPPESAGDPADAAVALLRATGYAPLPTGLTAAAAEAPPAATERLRDAAPRATRSS